MVDKVNRETRTKTMQSIKSKDTSLELRVREVLHRLGYRYSLHNKKLPGKPDLTLSRRKTVIFVHGCFWHCHHCRKNGRPASNQNYWDKKLARNKERFVEIKEQLESLNWRVLVLWECEAKNETAIETWANNYLAPNKQ